MGAQFNMGILAAAGASLGGGTPAVPVMAVKSFESGTTTGNLDVTDSNFAGVTPSANLTIASYHEPANDPAETPHAQICIGSKANSAQYSVARSADNWGNVEAIRTQNDADNTLQVLNRTSNAQIKRFNSSMIANGVRYSRSSNADANMRFQVAMFSDQVTAANGQVALGTGTSAISVSLAFQPDVVILHGIGAGQGAFVNDFGQFLGITTFDGSTYVRRSVGMIEDDNAVAGVPFQTINSTYSIFDMSNTGGFIYGVTADNFSGTGFDLTPSASAASDFVGYLALALPAGFKLLDFTTPTSTGALSITGAGFEPSAAILILTNLESIDHSFPLTASDLASGLSICMFNATDEVSTAIRMNHGSDPTDTASNCQDVAVLGPSATDTAAAVATLTAFTSDGATLNFTAVQGTGKKGFILFIE